MESSMGHVKMMFYNARIGILIMLDGRANKAGELKISYKTQMIHCCPI